MNSHPNSQELTVCPSDYSPENEVFLLKFCTMMEFPSSISKGLRFSSLFDHLLLNLDVFYYF